MEKVSLYIVHAEDFRAITGMAAPPTPCTYEKYQELGYPWFGLTDGLWQDSDGAEVFKSLTPVSEGPTTNADIW